MAAAQQFFFKILDAGAPAAQHDPLSVRIRLTNRFALFMCVSVLMYAPIFYFFGMLPAAAVCIPFGLFYIAVILLNYKRRSIYGRLWMIILGDLIIFSFSILFGKSIHAYWFFLLMAGYPLIFFLPGEKKYILFSYAFSALCYAAFETIGSYYLTGIIAVGAQLVPLLNRFMFITVGIFLTVMILNFFRAVHRAERESAIAHEELKTATAGLIHTEKLTAMGELAAGVAHELNQPLNVIKIITQSVLLDIRRGRFSRETAESDLPEITVQVDKMAGIIDHMRLFTRRQEGHSSVRMSVNEMIVNSFKFLTQQLADHGIILEKILSPVVPDISGDTLRLEQIIINLINNARYALEHSDTPQKRITVVSRAVTHEGKTAAAVEVRDNGAGIPDSILPKIFMPFYTTKKQGEGTGLGLSVSEKIAREHGGKLYALSVPGKETVFTLIIPAAE